MSYLKVLFCHFPGDGKEKVCQDRW